MSKAVIDAAVIARIAAEQRPSARRQLDRMTARDLEARTAYKALGMSAVQVRDAIYEEWERQSATQHERLARRPAAPPPPGRILRLVTEKAENLKWTAREFERCQPLLEAQSRKGPVRIGDLIFRGVEEGDWNNQRYSRSWHKQNGGVWEVSERRVDMFRVNRLGALEVVRSVHLPSFRGQWLIRSIAELLNVPRVRVPKALKPVQMGEYYSIERIRSIGGVDVYVRTLAAEFVDYCVVVGGETYHAGTLRGAIRGLRRKIAEGERAAAAKSALDEGVITAEFGFALGFCGQGMRDFCDHNHLDFHGSYTRGELRRIVAERQRENGARWGTELRRTGLL